MFGVMPKTCFLHLGLPKTASTSFQHTCMQNKILLKTRGVIFPIFNCIAANRNKIINHTQPIVSLFTDKPENYRVNKEWGIYEQIEEINKSYKKQLEHYLQCDEDLLFSGENIYALGEAGLSKFINKIRENNFNIKAIAMIRSPYSHLCSEIQQRIKRGEYIDLISLNNSIPKSFNAKSFSQARRASILKKVLRKNISFYSFEDACSDPHGPINFMIRKLLGHESSSYVVSDIKNESLFNLPVRMANEINKVSYSCNDNKKDAESLRILAEANLLFKSSGKFLLTQREERLVHSYINNEHKRILESTGINFPLNLIKFTTPLN